jgi:glutamate N-acetyltransferase/amino-acid N-acetyltransferase
MSRDTYIDTLIIPGVRFAVAASGTGYQGRPDMLLCAVEPGSQSAGVLTRNSCAAAPVRWSRERLKSGEMARALIINAGNANCYTGAAGMNAVTATADRVAAKLGITTDQVLICSTGKIGVPLSIDQVGAAVDDMAGRLSETGWADAARAIMTTDGWPKSATRHSQIAGVPVTLHGITKGTSMIAPNMATTISAVFTDAKIPSAVLQTALSGAVAKSYNCVSVDDTTSTNDSLLAFATGKAGNADVASAGDPALRRFRRDLESLLEEMSGLLLADARKDGRLVTIEVTGARSTVAARKIARSVSRSGLVRGMIADGLVMADGQSIGSRIVAAIGGAVQEVAADALVLKLGGAVIVDGGAIVIDDSGRAQENVSSDDVTLSIDVAVGQGRGAIRTVVVPS